MFICSKCSKKKLDVTAELYNKVNVPFSTDCIQRRFNFDQRSVKGLGGCELIVGIEQQQL